MQIRKYGRHWAIYDHNGDLICLTVYKRGAVEVIRRLQKMQVKEEADHGLGDHTCDSRNHH